MIATISSFRFSWHHRQIAKQIAGIGEQQHPQQRPNHVIGRKMTINYICPIPATNGAKVRTIGTKRARIMVFPP